MSTTSISIPVLNGDGSVFKLTLNVPAALQKGGRIAWSNTTTATGTLVASNDGLSALYKVVAAGTDTVTATPTPSVGVWLPGKKYLVGAQILDSNGHIQQVTAGAKYYVSKFTPDAGDIPQGGDHANPYYGVSGKAQFGTVLNMDPSTNGDWPAGGLNNGGAGIKPPTTGAAVSFQAGGYSAGRNEAGQDNNQAGIDTPTVYGTDSRVQIADYSEYGPLGLEEYYDAAGNLHVGWQVAAGTVDFSAPLSYPPAFNTSGGSVTDGDLTWTDQGAASAGSSVAINITAVAGASVPYGFYALLG